jgi:TatD DNase family protein
MNRDFKIFDVHSHLHSDFFNKRASGLEVADEMLEKGVMSVLVGVSSDDSRKSVEMSERFSNLFSSVGIHPTEKEEFSEKVFLTFLESSKVVAVGECGLDYY